MRVYSKKGVESVVLFEVEVEGRKARNDWRGKRTREADLGTLDGSG